MTFLTLDLENGSRVSAFAVLTNAPRMGAWQAQLQLMFMLPHKTTKNKTNHKKTRNQQRSCETASCKHVKNTMKATMAFEKERKGRNCKVGSQ